MRSELSSLWSNAGGSVPEHWNFVRFEELLLNPKSMSVGVMYPGKHDGAGVPLIRVADVKNGAVVNKPDFCIGETVHHEYRRTCLDGNELLITLVGNPGDCVIVEKYMADWNVARALAVVRLKDPDIRAWLRYVLLSNTAKHIIGARLNTTVQKTLNLKDIRSLPIPIAPLSERKSIVDAATALEDKINLNHQVNQTLEQMAQVIFKSWFVDFEPVKAKIAALEAGGSEDDALLAAMQAIAGSALFATDAADADAPTQLARLQVEHPEQYATLRATAELFPSAMQESELGEIPEGWSVCQVENILERLKPVKRYTKKEVSSTGLVPVFEQGADILLGFHNEKAGFTADAKNPAFVFGDHTCITHLSCQDFDISQNVIPLRGRNRSTIWVYYAIQGKQAFQEYRRHWSELIVKPVIYPTRDICERYSETVLRMICFKESLERENRSLAELRDTLLPKLLSGEIDVSALADNTEANA